MKLATVHPELNFVTEQIPKDILHLRDGCSAIIGLVPGMTTSQHQLHQYGLMQSEMLTCNIPNSGEMLRATFPEVSAMAQISSAWNDELQNVVQIGFIPNPPLSESERNGRSPYVVLSQSMVYSRRLYPIYRGSYYLHWL